MIYQFDAKFKWNGHCGDFANQAATCEKISILENLPHNCRGRRRDSCLEILDRDEIICANSLRFKSVSLKSVSIPLPEDRPCVGCFSDAEINDHHDADILKLMAVQAARGLLMNFEAPGQCKLDLISVENFKSKVNNTR